MPLNFNVDPYYDDFDPTKNFHRVLFKPGVAVQARELTQSQTILQDQITKFADNIFKQNSPVTGGQVTVNLNCQYIKLQSTYEGADIDVNDFDGEIIQDATGTIIAQVIAVAESTSTVEGEGDPKTLVVVYKTANRFTDGSVIYGSDTNITAQAITLNATGNSSVVSIAQGVFYISSNYKRSDGIVIYNGTFVQVNPQTSILSKYSNSPSLRVGLVINETIHDYIDDPSLLDPAIGASNYQAPGADRYVITLTLETRPTDVFTDDQGFIQLLKVTNGSVAKLVDGSVYNVIDDYFAKRDYETNGDYIVSDFKLQPKANTASVGNTTYIMSVGKGIAYVNGYRVENPAPIELTSNRARTTESYTQNPVFVDYGSYFYVNNLKGANNSFFDVTTAQSIDFHCVVPTDLNISSNATYSSTIAATGFIRNLSYDHSANTNDANTTAHVYKAYVYDIQNNTLSANVASGGLSSTQIKFPSTYSSSSGNTAYVGASISIIKGKSAGDIVTITSYDGPNRIATVSQPWTAGAVDTTSVFNINFETKNIKSLVSASASSTITTIKGSAIIDPESRDGLNNTALENPTIPEMIFNIGNPYVSTLANTAYTATQTFRNINLNSGTATLDLSSYGSGSGAVLTHNGSSSDALKQNMVLIVTGKTGGSTSPYALGDIVPWSVTGRSASLSADKTVLTLTASDTSNVNGITVAAIVKVNALGTSSGRILKYKYLINANTVAVNLSGTNVNSYTWVDNSPSTSFGQVYIRAPGIVGPGQSQSLYLSDVRNIVKIVDSKAAGTDVTNAMLSDPSYDITRNYMFDSGQRDNYYDHASIKLRPGAPKPSGNILVLLNYYQHTGGDGYFSILSYINSTSPENYNNIPAYVSKNGTSYSLRDCIDFRPTRKNAQTSFDFDYATSDDRKGTLLPMNATTFYGNYSYYLGRRDILVLTKDKLFEIIEGTPSTKPILPTKPDTSLAIAILNHRPYTGYLPTEAPTGRYPDLSVDAVKHKRYTMQDIAGLDKRIERIEYYTSLNTLEQKTQSLQIMDALNLNRFKNGILVDDFSDYSAADVLNSDYFASLNPRKKVLTAGHFVNNYPLKCIATVYSLNNLNSATKSSLGYGLYSDGNINQFSLPYTSAPTIIQEKASREVNVNEFAYPTSEGALLLTPNVDNWVDNQQTEALLVTGVQVFTPGQKQNLLTSGDWQTVASTTSTDVSRSSSSSSISLENHNFEVDWGYGLGHGMTITTTQDTTTYVTTTTSYQEQKQVFGNYDKLDNTYSLNNNYIQNVGVLPWIRKQQIILRTENLLAFSELHAFFDNVNIDNYIRKTNIIELTGVTGIFKPGDIVGYTSGGLFYPTASVVGVYTYTDTTKVRLYVAAELGGISSYSSSTTLKSGSFNTSGNYVSSPATGTIASTSHNAGSVAATSTGSSITLSLFASATNNYYTGNTVYIVAGDGVGRHATVTGYNGSTKVATIDASITTSAGDTYSIGAFNSNESGSFYAIFNVPAGIFHTGEKIVRIDNRTGGDITTARTFAEGTFWSGGLTTTSRNIAFGASPAGAPNTFTRTNSRVVTSSSSSSTSSFSQSTADYDPLAQSFKIEGLNYPNGMFLNSIKLFFRGKPTGTDTSQISLYIVPTLNGYPEGTILSNSYVTLDPVNVKVSESPHYLNSDTYTTFQFNAPVYIEPDKLYAFIIKSKSNKYRLWSAHFQDEQRASTSVTNPGDIPPSPLPKITASPYVGTLFMSQNAITWTADQNQSLMFVAEQCVFDTSVSPSIQFVVPRNLPERDVIDQSLDYYKKANNLSSAAVSLTYANVAFDAMNMTTTDFTPTGSAISYSYNATLSSGLAAGTQYIHPGKFASTMYDNIYFNDGQGERKLFANSDTSFSMYARLSSSDPAISPIISGAGTSLYTIEWNINDCELSNNLINIVSGGSGYNVACTTVTVSAPTGIGGQQAYASANVVDGIITEVYFTSVGSGYVETPTLTIVDANTTPGIDASVTVTGETSKYGGPAVARYLTKKVTLEAGFDAGDLAVYISAYRPINTDILVYYKILNRNDTQKFEDSSWQLMTMTKGGSTYYSQTREDIYEYTFAPGTNGVDQGYVTYTSSNGQTYTMFSQFAIKIVLRSSEHTYVPFLTDMRAIALPPNV